jgi:hypothetical protein
MSCGECKFGVLKAHALLQSCSDFDDGVKKMEKLKRKGGARGKYVKHGNHVKILAMSIMQRRSSASKVLHLKSKLFWDGVKDDGVRPVIAHDTLHKLHHIEFDEEHFDGYQILMHEIARKLLDGTKENIKWQKVEWMKDGLLKHNFLILNA